MAFFMLSKLLLQQMALICCNNIYGVPIQTFQAIINLIEIVYETDGTRVQIKMIIHFVYSTKLEAHCSVFRFFIHIWNKIFIVSINFLSIGLHWFAFSQEIPKIQRKFQMPRVTINCLFFFQFQRCCSKSIHCRRGLEFPTVH